MTEEQKELRDERIAIMTVEGVPLEEAKRYCDDNWKVYGSERNIVQNELF